MKPKPWYSLRGAERAAAKAAFEAAHSLPLFRKTMHRGPRPCEIEIRDDAIVVRSNVYRFDDHGGKVLAKLLAYSGCPPLPPGCQFTDLGATIQVVGPRGTIAKFDTRGTATAVSHLIEYRHLAKHENAANHTTGRT